MNKFTKGCIIAAIIFILLGVVIVVSAFAVGGVDGIAEVVRNGDLVYYSNNDFDDWYDDDGEDDYLSASGQEVSIDHLAEAEEVKELTVEIGERLLIIQSTDDTNYSIECEDIDKLKCYVDGNELIIVDKRRHKNNNWNNEEIYLNIPEKALLSDISIKMGAGKIIADQLVADELSVGIGAGKMELAEVNAKESSFNIGAGEIIINSGILKDTELSVATGRIDFEGTIQGELDAECSVGTISMLLSGTEEDHNYEVASSMGTISVAGNSMSGFAEKRTMHNDAASNFELKCSMGTINIDFEE